jgi:hypothetical protein
VTTRATDTPALRKARGAFFTPPELTGFLAGWAIRSADDAACGDAAFLLPAARRLSALATVTIIDADPNQPVLRWSRKPGKPASLTVIGGATEETLIDVIDAAARKTAFVIVDLEGTASVMVAHAMTRSDLVIIPTKGSELDGIEAAKVIQFIRRQERAYSRKIPFAVLFTQTNPAVRPRTLKSLEADMLGDVQFPEVLIEIDGLTRFSWIRRRPRSAARCRTRTGNSVTTALSDYSPRLALRLRPFAHHGGGSYDDEVVDRAVLDTDDVDGADALSPRLSGSEKR